MVQFGLNYLKKINYEKPRNWSFALQYTEDIENYIMEMSIPGTYTSTMVVTAANHAAFIADYGWDKYCREMRKPTDIGNVKEFFYDSSFDDYDPKNVEIKDPFANLKIEEDINYDDYEDEAEFEDEPEEDA